jgi:hypothetical protein
MGRSGRGKDLGAGEKSAQFEKAAPGGAEGSHKIFGESINIFIDYQ